MTKITEEIQARKPCMWLSEIVSFGGCSELKALHRYKYLITNQANLGFTVSPLFCTSLCMTDICGAR